MWNVASKISWWWIQVDPEDARENQFSTLIILQDGITIIFLFFYKLFFYQHI